MQMLAGTQKSLRALPQWAVRQAARLNVGPVGEHVDEGGCELKSFE